MLRALLYLLVCLVIGWLFAFMQVPAGWLIGPLLVGVFYRLKIGEFSLPPYVFPFALALIGACIGLTMKVSMFGELAAYFLPLIISLVAILLGAWLLSRVLTRYSTIDPKTTLFCCIPGGMTRLCHKHAEYGSRWCPADVINGSCLASRRLNCSRYPTRTSAGYFYTVTYHDPDSHEKSLQ